MKGVAVHMAEDPSKDHSSDSGRKENIFEVLDELIFHLNSTKGIFRLLIFSSFILAPLAIVFAIVLLSHPRFLFAVRNNFPELTALILVFISVSVILSSLWLYVGAKEHRFFSRWSSRFQRFMSLKDRIDRELGD